MESKKEYILTCWHCSAGYDAMEAPFCNHADSTKVCPFCLNCFCDASNEYKRKFLDNSPRELLEAKISALEGSDLKLGELLIKAGKITQPQLDIAIQQQAVENKQLGAILVEMGMVTTQDLNVVLLDQKELDEFNLDHFKLNLTLVERIGTRFCLDYQFVPIEYLTNGKENILRLAVPSQEAFKKLKKSSRLEKLVLIPYRSDKDKLMALLENIADDEIFELS